MGDLTTVVSLALSFFRAGLNLAYTLRMELANAEPDHALYYRFITGDSVADSKDYLD